MEPKASGALCGECPLAKYKFCPPENDTPMFHEGPRIAFVGESPGADEIFDQRPFVGASGNLFNAMLTARGVNRNDVLVTNATLCRPPKVKDDEKAEHELYGSTSSPTYPETGLCMPRLYRDSSAHSFAL